MEAPRRKSARDLHWKASSSSSSSSSSAITNLPSSILMEILCRLPIKTLVASKSVCKSWLHLTKDPEFIKLHQSRAPIEVCFHSSCDEITTKLHIGTFHFPNSPVIKLDALLQFPRFGVRSNNALNYKAKKTNINISFVNSCNGLICFFCQTTHFAMIWNPITREMVTFPAPVSMPMYCTYGLGFSRKTNRFKLLRVLTQGAWQFADICTIEKTWSWKRIGPPCSYSAHPFPMDMCHSAFLQGVLYWVDGGRHGLDVALFSFDFECDKFGEVPLPPHLEKYAGPPGDWVLDECRPRVGVLKGCLLISDMTEDGANMWLMKEHGVRESWTKVFSLQFTKIEGLTYKCCVPLTYLDNGEILMTRQVSGQCTTDVISYNPVLKTITILGFGDVHQVIAYRPSLVSLKDSLMGYKVHVKLRSPFVEHKETTTPSLWQSMFASESAPERGSKACVTDAQYCDAVTGEKSKGHVSAASESSMPESSASKLASAQGNEAFTTGKGKDNPFSSVDVETINHMTD